MPARRAKGANVCPEIVDAAEGLDADRDLSRLPVAVSEVVEVEVAAALGREEQIARPTGR
jgi:hypothetical protein